MPRKNIIRKKILFAQKYTTITPGNKYTQTIYQSTNNTSLHYNCYKANIGEIISLLQNGICQDTEDIYGNTSLHISVIQNNPALVKLLLTYKANPNIQNKEGKTPLMLAIEQDYQEIFDILISYEINYILGDNNQNTILHYAVKTYNIHYTKEILKKTSESLIYRYNINGCTPLTVSIIYNNTDAIYLLNNYQLKYNNQEETDDYLTIARALCDMESKSIYAFCNESTANISVETLKVITAPEVSKFYNDDELSNNTLLNYIPFDPDYTLTLGLSDEVLLLQKPDSEPFFTHTNTQYESVNSINKTCEKSPEKTSGENNIQGKKRKFIDIVTEPNISYLQRL